jgi:acyl phosphate:glycerol-3-phosphate acyltransferase
MTMLINSLWITGLAYALGSIPFGVLVGYGVTRRDIRAGGSGHSGATNTFRQAGVWAAVLVAVLDLGKGFVAGWLARTFGQSEWVIALAGTAVVIGHCWPLWAGFRGGMGLGTVGGVLLAVYPLGFALGLALAAAGTLIMRHTARGNILAGVLLGPVLWLFSQSLVMGVLGAGMGLVVAARSLSDWNRVYRELWLDREKRA